MPRFSHIALNRATVPTKITIPFSRLKFCLDDPVFDCAISNSTVIIFVYKLAALLHGWIRISCFLRGTQTKKNILNLYLCNFLA